MRGYFLFAWARREACDTNWGIRERKRRVFSSEDFFTVSHECPNFMEVQYWITVVLFWGYKVVEYQLL